VVPSIRLPPITTSFGLALIPAIGSEGPFGMPFNLSLDLAITSSTLDAEPVSMQRRLWHAA
jgi:hypothetical protein